MAGDDLWVFGYGSLMWRPGFEFVEQRQARLHGAHRALCVLSHVHRGTRERPGLVLGLDLGGACRGIAFRVSPHAADDVVAYLRAREQVTGVYLETNRAISLLDGSNRSVRALVYVVDRDHHQYSGALPRAKILSHVKQGYGQSGPNPEYVLNTAAHLRELGIRDPILEWLAGELKSDSTATGNG